MFDPLPQETHLPDEHRLHARLLEALLCEVNVQVYDQPVPPPTREQFLATLLDVAAEIAARNYGANRPTFAEAPWAPEEPGESELLALHLLVDKIENHLGQVSPQIGYRDNGTGGFRRDVYLRILGNERDLNRLVQAGYVQVCRSDPRYYRYSYTPYSGQ